MSQEIANPNPGELRDVVATLVSRHGPKWLRFVVRIVGNTVDAEDVLQEAVQRVLARNRRLSTEDEVRMYLGRAIANRAIELYHCRRRERRRNLPLEDCPATAVPDQGAQRDLEDLECRAERERLLDLIGEGLAHLPAKQYEALRLTLFERPHTSIRDAGLERGIPYSTLRHRSVQGIRRLQKFVRRALRSSEF